MKRPWEIMTRLDGKHFDPGRGPDTLPYVWGCTCELQRASNEFLVLRDECEELGLLDIISPTRGYLLPHQSWFRLGDEMSSTMFRLFRGHPWQDVNLKLADLLLLSGIGVKTAGWLVAMHDELAARTKQ